MNDITKNLTLRDIESNVLDIEELNYFGHFEIVTNIILEWKSKADQSNNTKVKEELHSVADSLARIGIYVSQMQERQREYNVQITAWRHAKLKAEAKLLELESKIKTFKNNLEYDAIRLRFRQLFRQFR
jgi:hypothetical protein